MAIYSGETIRIRTSATDFEGLTLTNDDVTAAEITFYDQAGDPVHGPAVMQYDSGNVRWFYDWNTTGMSGGQYRIKVRLTGLLFDSWEYARVRLSDNPV